MRWEFSFPFTLAVLVPSIFAAGKPDGWVAVHNSHIDIYSQTGGETSQRALVWFEHLRTVFAQPGFLGAIPLPSELPHLRVIGFRSAEEYIPYRIRSEGDAFYAQAGGREFIVLPSLEPRNYSLAAHEYAHFTLHAAGLHLPDWLAEGLAEYCSTLRTTESGYEIGGELPARIQTLQLKSWTPLAELFNLSLRASAPRTKADLERFYALSWALVDMLMTAPDYRSRFATFVAELDSGTSGMEGFATIYGKSLEIVTHDLINWFKQKPSAIRVRSPLPDVAPARSDSLSDVESEILLADLLAATGKLERAREEYAAIAKKSPHDATVRAALGSLAFSRGDKEGALREWRQALDDGLNDADVSFRFAVTAEEAGAPQAEIRTALQRAITLRPRFDAARFRLALLESNAGNYREAVEHLHAMAVPAGASAYGYWSALANALNELGRREQALEAARGAFTAATTEQEREHARQLAYYATTEVKTQFVHDVNGRVTMTTTRVKAGATGWNPFVEPLDQMRRSEGDLIEVLCSGDKLTGFRVLTADGILTLNVPDPGHVLIENNPGELTCGPAEKKKPVRVDYAAESAGGGTNILRGMLFN